MGVPEIDPFVGKPLPRGQVRCLGPTMILNEEDAHLLSDEQKSSFVEVKRSDGLIYFYTGKKDINAWEKAWKEDPEFGNALHLAVTKGVTEPLAQYLCSDNPFSRAYKPFLVVQNSAGREYDEDIANAWREDPEFGNALHLAVVLGDTKPLLQYLCSDKPLSRINRCTLAGYIGQLVERTRKHRRGRPRRNAAKVDPVEQAERNAAWAVAFMQKEWRKKHGRPRVPGDKLAKMIGEARKEAARTFGVPETAIRKEKIGSALKTGRIRVA